MQIFGDEEEEVKDKICSKYKLFVFVVSLELENMEEQTAFIGEINTHLRQYAA